MKKLTTLIITAIALIAITIFTLQNSQVISISLFLWEIEASLSLILFTTFSIAILISVIAIIPTVYHLKKLRQRSQQKIKNLIEEKEKITDANIQDTAEGMR